MTIQEAAPIELTEQERSALEALMRSPKTEHGIVERARIVLLAAKTVVHEKPLKSRFSDL